MKNSKKIISLLVAVILLLTFSVSANAAETTYELFVKNNALNHTYDAYQIFSGTISSDGTTLSNIGWGSSIDDPEALVTALTTDTKKIVTNAGETTLKDVFISLTSDTNSKLPVEKKAKLVADILGTISNDSTTLDRFAELVGEVIYDSNGDFDSHKYLGAPTSTSSSQSTDDEGNKGYKISNLPAGYYLVKDRDNTVDTSEADFYTKYIVRVVRSASIIVKGEGVKVEKTVNDTIGGTFNDYEDAYTNDTLYFKWEGTLPNNLATYDEYNYKFIDNMSKGLDFLKFEQVYIENANGSVAHVFYDVTGELSKDDSVKTLPSDIVKTDPQLKGNTWEFSLEFVDLLKSYPSIIPSQKVIVKYSARVNKDAVLNGSNPNEVKIEYDNNPNGEGTGTSVSDVAHAFTFKIDIDKYDSANSATKLEGVQFILYYRDTVESQITYHYAKVITEEMVEAGEKVNGKDLTPADVGVVYGFTSNRDEASILDTDANGAINLKGLDSGIFYLEEIATNDGYNLLDTPVQIEITPSYTLTGEECSVVVNYEVDGMDQGTSHTVGVRNSKGSTLPSTGGIGTTIFYVLGGLLAVGAVVLLITKKRMSVEK